MEESTEVVVSIHGTFVAKPEDAGHEWWQHNSDFWQALAEKLPKHIQQIPREQTFHWNGKNSATERRAAAKNLLKLLEQLENAGRPYHLIGHSHGGSVIWDTLLLASRQRKWRRHAEQGEELFPLPGLISWTTVGTPYIISRASLLRILLAFFSGVVMLTSLFFLYILVVDHWSGQKDLFDGHAGYLWSYVIVFAIFYPALAGTIAGLESQRADTESQTARKILRTLGDRWLGLWHSSDEAINGLKLSVALSGDIIARRHKLFRSFTYPGLAMLFAPLALVVNPIFNWMLAPVGDRFVWKRIKNSATGNDRPGTYAKDIATAPLPGSDSLPSLPHTIENTLTAAADQATQEAAPRLRELLGRLSNGLGKGLVVEIQQSGLSGRELIHTSYFDSSEVALLIAQHLGKHSRKQKNIDVPDELRGWPDEFHVAVGKLLSSQPASLAMIWRALLILAILVAALFLASKLGILGW